LLAVEVSHSIELRHPLQGTIETVIPAVIWAMEDRGLPARFTNNRSRVMTAHVEETSQYTVMAAHNDNRFSGDVRSYELAGAFYLLHTSNHLPGLTEDCPSFEVSDARIHVPGGWDGRSFCQRRLRIV
jgi:hypothetical protein